MCIGGTGKLETQRKLDPLTECSLVNLNERELNLFNYPFVLELFKIGSWEEFACEAILG